MKHGGMHRPSAVMSRHSGAPPAVAALLQRCSSGDLSAWGELVDRYSALVFSVPIRLGLSPEDAADVVQDTFSTLLVRLGDIEKPESLGSWLMTVARRSSWRRRAAQRPVVELQEDVLIDASFDDRSLQAIALQRAIEAVGEPCTSLIKLLFLDPAEPGYGEIARCLGCAIGNVGPLRGRCLDRLRRVLGREEW